MLLGQRCAVHHYGYQSSCAVVSSAQSPVRYRRCSDLAAWLLLLCSCRRCVVTVPTCAEFVRIACRLITDQASFISLASNTTTTTSINIRPIIIRSNVGSHGLMQFFPFRGVLPERQSPSRYSPHFNLATHRPHTMSLPSANLPPGDGLRLYFWPFHPSSRPGPAVRCVEWWSYEGGEPDGG